MKKSMLSFICIALFMILAYSELKRFHKQPINLQTEFSKELIAPLYDGINASSKMGRFIRLLLQ